MKSRRLMSAVSALVLGISSMFVMTPAMVSAAVDICTWTGGGADLNFSTAANWSCSIDGAVAPENGDSLIFDDSSLTESQTVNNDITSLSLNEITFSGSGDTYRFTLGGNEIILTGGITSTTQTFPEILNDITLAADQSFTGSMRLGNFDTANSIDIGNHILNMNVDTLNCNVQQIYSIVSGTGELTKTGAGASNLLGANTYSGTTTVSEGFLGIGHEATAGSVEGATVIASGATVGFRVNEGTVTVNEDIAVGGTGLVGLAKRGAIVDYTYGCSGGGAPETPPTLKLAGDITLTADTVFASTNASFEIAGALTGNFAVSMADGSGGDLIVNSSNNTSKTPNGIAESEAVVVEYKENAPETSIYVDTNEIAVVTGTYGDVTVENGGTLKGTGTIGQLFVNETGTLAPGLSPGCLTSGNLTLNGTYEVEVAGTTVCEQYDQTKVTGTVDVTGGTLNVSFLNDYLPVAGDSFVIISNDGEDKVTGTFEGLAEGATVTVGEVAFKISYVGGDGNDVTLTVISSPDTGFGILSTNPIVTLLGSTLAAGAILAISRRYARAK